MKIINLCLCACLAAGAAAGVEDRPVAVRAAQADAFEDAIARSVEKARETLDDASARYFAVLRGKARFFCTVRLADDRGRVEQVFVEIDKWDSKISGRINNEIHRLQGYAKGQAVAFDHADVLDWTILHNDGREEGNFIGKFLRARAAVRPAAK